MSNCKLSVHPDAWSYPPLSHRSMVYRRDPGYSDPVTGSIGAGMGAFTDLSVGLSNVSIGLSSRKKPTKDSSGDSAMSSTPSLPTIPDVEGVSELPASTPFLTSRESASSMSPPVSTNAQPLDRPVLSERRSSRTKKGLIRLAVGTKTAIVDIPLAVTQGTHNMPRLYGDKTVREQDEIKGVGSSMTAAGKELMYGT